MTPIDLTNAELALIREIADTAYRDLKEEIYKTEDTGYKHQLKGREAIFEGLLGKLSSAAGPGR